MLCLTGAEAMVVLTGGELLVSTVIYGTYATRSYICPSM